MIELINKKDVIHDLCTLDLSSEDMEKVESFINNYETIYFDTAYMYEQVD